MNAPTDVSVRHVAFGFGAGALFMGLVTVVGTALAQAPFFLAPDMLQMLEWCRQMMGSIDIQAMLETCRGMMGQAGSMMQGMMSGMCMGR